VIWLLVAALLVVAAGVAVFYLRDGSRRTPIEAARPAPPAPPPPPRRPVFFKRYDPDEE
jgi:hypothetical protein